MNGQLLIAQPLIGTSEVVYTMSCVTILDPLPSFTLGCILLAILGWFDSPFSRVNDSVVPRFRGVHFGHPAMLFRAGCWLCCVDGDSGASWGTGDGRLGLVHLDVGPVVRWKALPFSRVTKADFLYLSIVCPCVCGCQAEDLCVPSPGTRNHLSLTQTSFCRCLPLRSNHLPQLGNLWATGSSHAGRRA